MAFSYAPYTGDGTQTDFNVTFAYLEKSHVEVTVDGVITTAWSWVTDASIRFDTAPAQGAVIRIQRKTSRANRLTDYQAPSALLESELNIDSTQAFYLGQEALDIAGDALGQNPNVTEWLGEGKPLKNIADPIDAQDAATRNYVLSQISSYSDEFDTELTAAEAARDAAETSETNAAASETNAASSASSAQTFADEAEDAAQTLPKEYDTVSDFQAASPPSSAQTARTAGFINSGDGGGSLYKRVVSEPSHAGKVQSADGEWWELVPVEGIFNVLAFGADPTKTSDSTTAIQNAIDAAEAAYAGGSFGGDTPTVFIPPGRYLHTGLLIPQGVRLLGGGAARTVMYLSGAGSTGFRCAAADTQLSADGVTYFRAEGFSWVTDEATPSSQRQWNATGFSRFIIRDMVFEWCGGCNGIEVVGATRATDGGASNWYNTLDNCYFIRRASMPSGGVAMNLGDPDGTLEKITTWSFFGVQVNGAGSGTGLVLNGTGCVGDVVVESCNSNVIIGSAGATRMTSDNHLRVYIEGGGTGITLGAASERNTIYPTIITSTTGAAITDNGTDNQLIKSGDMKLAVQDTADSFVFQVSDISGINLPKIKGKTPGLLIHDVNSSGGFGRIISSAGAAGISSNALRFFAGTGEGTSLGTEVLKMGTAQVLPGSDTGIGLGGPSNRFNSVYAEQFRPGTGGPIWTSGAGTPEGVVTAPVGSLYTRTDGGAGTTLYVKESGSSNTGWVAK